MTAIQTRYIKRSVRDELKSKMVFVGGPRQVGKTTFALTLLSKPTELFAVECKSGEKNVNPSLFYFMERTQIPRFYQAHAGQKDYEKNGVRVLPVQKFIKELSLP